MKIKKLKMKIRPFPRAKFIDAPSFVFIYLPIKYFLHKYQIIMYMKR